MSSFDEARESFDEALAAAFSAAIPKAPDAVSEDAVERVARALNAEACRQRGLNDPDDWSIVTEQERGAWRLMAPKLGWTKPRGDRPAFIDLSEIAAIVWGEAPEDAA